MKTNYKSSALNAIILLNLLIEMASKPANEWVISCVCTIVRWQSNSGFLDTMSCDWRVIERCVLRQAMTLHNLVHNIFTFFRQNTTHVYIGTYVCLNRLNRTMNQITSALFIKIISNLSMAFIIIMQFCGHQYILCIILLFLFFCTFTASITVPLSYTTPSLHHSSCPSAVNHSRSFTYSCPK